MTGRYVIDTHTLLWWLSGDPQLPDNTCQRTVLDELWNEPLES